MAIGSVANTLPTSTTTPPTPTWVYAPITALRAPLGFRGGQYVNPARLSALLGIAEGDAVVDVLRLRSLDGRPTMLERLSFTAPVGRVLFDVDLDTVSITEYLESRGFAGATVEHEIDAVAADETDAKLLGVPGGFPILRLRRISRDANGQRYEASDDRYLSDIVRFTVSASGRSQRGDAYVRTLSGA